MSRTHALTASAVIGETPAGQPRFAFSDRAHGNTSLLVGEGDAVEARARLASLVAVQPQALVFMEQVHGAAVAVVDHSHRGRGFSTHAEAIPGADALITAEAGTALAVLTADCVPVLFAAQGVVAAAHAGREGLRKGVLEQTVHAFAEFGITPQDLTAVIGPAIGPCCYEVPEALAAQTEQELVGSAAQTTWGSASLDLPTAAEVLLERLNVRDVSRNGQCTRCTPQRWFSHRGATDGREPQVPAGRQASVVVWDAGESHQMAASDLRGQADGLA